MKFDVSTPIEIQARSDTGIEPIQLRWPTDKEWAPRHWARKLISRNLGRGVKQTLPIEPTAEDLKLYHAIALNGAPAISQAEAMRILDSLGQSDTIDTRLEGNQIICELYVISGEVTHTLKVPSATSVQRYRAAAFQYLDLPNNHTAARFRLEPAVELYDECGGHSDDYEGPIPAIHKEAVVRATLECIDRALGPKRKGDENF